MSAESVLGLAVRYGEHFAPPEGTIAAHEAVIEENGFVWFGKMGARIGGARANALLSQLEQGVDTPLILVRARVNGRTVHRCHVQRISLEAPPADERGAIPDYYRNRRDVGVWFRVSQIQQIDSRWLSHVKVSSSQRPLPETLASSVASFFYVVVPAAMEDELAQ